MSISENEKLKNGKRSRLNSIWKNEDSSDLKKL